MSETLVHQIRRIVNVDEAFKKDSSLQDLAQSLNQYAAMHGFAAEDIARIYEILQLCYSKGAIYGMSLASELLTTHFSKDTKQVQNI